MILFDLKCRQDHVFEAWFHDNETFEGQAKAGEIACPICGDETIAKAPMAPHLASGRESKIAPKDGAREAAATTMRSLRRLREEIEKNSDYVGHGFAEHARRIHYGETERRNIHGEATGDEAKDLRDEGIRFCTVPWVPPADS